MNLFNLVDKDLLGENEKTKELKKITEAIRRREASVRNCGEERRSLRHVMAMRRFNKR